MAGGLDLFSVQQEIKEYLIDSIPQFTVVSGGVPTAESLPFVNGALEPYVVLRFSDMMPTSGGGSWMGAQWDEYYSYVDGLCLGPTEDDARELANLVNSWMLGKKLSNASAIKKNYGGGSFAIFAEANRNPVAFVATTSFRFGTNVEDVGAGSRL